MGTIMRLMEGRQRVLGVGEIGSSMISNTVRAYTKRFFAAAASRETLLLPSSDVEQIASLGAQPITASYDTRDGRAPDGKLVMGHTVLQYTFKIHPNSTGGNSSSIRVLTKYYDQQYLDTNIGLGLHDMDVRTSVDITLSSIDNQELYYEYHLPVSGQFLCDWSENGYDHQITCPAPHDELFDFNVNWPADYTSDFDYSCPGQIDVPGCYSLLTSSSSSSSSSSGSSSGSDVDWIGDYDVDPDCTMITFTPFEATCRCITTLGSDSSSSSSRRLSMKTTDDGSTIITKEYTTRRESTYFPLTTSVIYHEPNIPDENVALTVGLFSTMLLALLFFAYALNLDRKKIFWFS